MHAHNPTTMAFLNLCVNKFKLLYLTKSIGQFSVVLLLVLQQHSIRSILPSLAWQYHTHIYLLHFWSFLLSVRL